MEIFANTTINPLLLDSVGKTDQASFPSHNCAFNHSRNCLLSLHRLFNLITLKFTILRQLDKLATSYLAWVILSLAYISIHAQRVPDINVKEEEATTKSNCDVKRGSRVGEILINVDWFILLRWLHGGANESKTAGTII